MRTTDTYRLAFYGDLLLATARDPDTALAKALDEVREAVLDADEDDIRISGPVYLLDDEDEVEPGEEQVYSGTDRGWLEDDSGRTYGYAVRA